MKSSRGGGLFADAEVEGKPSPLAVVFEPSLRGCGIAITVGVGATVSLGGSGGGTSTVGSGADRIVVVASGAIGGTALPDECSDVATNATTPPSESITAATTAQCAKGVRFGFCSTNVDRPLSRIAADGRISPDGGREDLCFPE